MAEFWQGRPVEAGKPREDGCTDGRLLRQDINGGMAHATMLGEQGLLSEEDRETILTALQDLLTDLQYGYLKLDPGTKDALAFLDAALDERVPGAAEKLSVGRSREGRLALALRLTLRDEAETVQGLLLKLTEQLCRRGAGLTEEQNACVWMLLRDAARLREGLSRLMEACPLESGEDSSLDRELPALLLGFAGPCASGPDGLTDRDYCQELGMDFMLCAEHLCRLAAALEADEPGALAGDVSLRFTVLLARLGELNQTGSPEAPEERTALWQAVDALEQSLAGLAGAAAGIGDEQPLEEDDPLAEALALVADFRRELEGEDDPEEGEA